MQVLIADATSLVRTGLIHLLGIELPDSEFFEATEMAEVSAMMEDNAPELLVIDPDLPGCEGEAGLEALREENATLRILVLTSRDERSAILGFLTCGMNACIVKSMPNEQLLVAVRTILGGGVYAPLMLTQVHRRSAGAAATPAPMRDLSMAGACLAVAVPPDVTSAAGISVAGISVAGLPALTERQKDVLRLLAEGRSTKDIARTLELGVGTVKVHLSAVYRTLGAHSRMEAVIRAGALRY